jgi:putative transmembrane protein
LLASEELIGQISEKYKFSFTTKEVQLCCLILEDKSIAEISRVLYINESTVRANRSRVRKKMKLDKKTNLKAHLLMLLAEEKNRSPDKNQE